MKWLIFVLPVLFAGCINIATHMQPINPDVKAILTGKDCTPIFAGFGYGVNTVEHAMKRGLKDNEASGGYVTAHFAPITKIRSIAITEMNVLIFGERCVEVEGE